MKALVVDDVEAGRIVLGTRLEDAGLEVHYACDGLDALRRLRSVSPDVVVSDLHMPSLDGLGLLARIRQLSDIPFVMITVFGSIPDCEAAIRQGADRFLQFARDAERVGAIARSLVEAHRERRAAGSWSDPMPDGRELDRPRTAEEARARAQIELRLELQRLVVECRGNIAEIARRMGRDRSTVRYHLRRLGLLDATNRSLRLSSQPSAIGPESDASRGG